MGFIWFMLGGLCSAVGMGVLSGRAYEKGWKDGCNSKWEQLDN